MMGHKEELKGGAEADLLFGKNVYCYLQRSKVKKNIKKQISRRIRRTTAKDIQHEINNCEEFDRL